MTSGGLGTMGYGLASSIGVQVAHPKKLVIEYCWGSILVNEYAGNGDSHSINGLPVKQFILNNERLGMVRQWQELNHGTRILSKLV